VKGRSVNLNEVVEWKESKQAREWRIKRVWRHYFDMLFLRNIITSPITVEVMAHL
jgi:hypothetical protein